MCLQKYHWTALKHLLRYLNPNNYEGWWFWYRNVNGFPDVYCNANWGQEGLRLTRICIVFLYGSPSVWVSRNKSFVAMRTDNTQYTVLRISTHKLVWVINSICDNVKKKLKEIFLCNSTTSFEVTTGWHLE